MKWRKRLDAVLDPRLERASMHSTYRQVAAAMVRRSPRLLFAFARRTAFQPVQKRGEIISFLELLRQNPPETLLEIGTSRGGTFFMMCQVARPGARLVTIDVEERAPVRVETFGRRRQHVISLRGDSTDPAVRATIGDLFPTGLDVLFIDGDHSYDGVAKDEACYRSLVRPGGLVVFHDIVLDDGQRTGTPSVTWSGGVPRFWSEFKAAHADWDVIELVDSWQQSGFGIGVAIRPPA